MRIPFWQAGVLAVLIVALPVPGETKRQDYALGDLAFLAGCWSGSLGDESGVMEEFYTVPSENLILGTTRYLRKGTAIQYEFTRIEKIDSGIRMVPYPGGEPSQDAFRLTSLRNGVAIFEAPEHDYPKRIIYRANRDGTRTARIDAGAGDPKGQEWELQPVDCPRSGG